MSKFKPLFVLSCLALTACGTAQIVRRDESGGQIALSGSYMDATRKARVQMAESCGGFFDASDFRHGLRFSCNSYHEPKAPTLLVKR